MLNKLLVIFVLVIFLETLECTQPVVADTPNFCFIDLEVDGYDVCPNGTLTNIEFPLFGMNEIWYRKPHFIPVKMINPDVQNPADFGWTEWPPNSGYAYMCSSKILTPTQCEDKCLRGIGGAGVTCSGDEGFCNASVIACQTSGTCNCQRIGIIEYIEYEGSFITNLTEADAFRYVTPNPIPTDHFKRTVLVNDEYKLHIYIDQPQDADDVYGLRFTFNPTVSVGWLNWKVRSRTYHTYASGKAVANDESLFTGTLPLEAVKHGAIIEASVVNNLGDTLATANKTLVGQDVCVEVNCYYTCINTYIHSELRKCVPWYIYAGWVVYLAIFLCVTVYCFWPFLHILYVIVSFPFRCCFYFKNIRHTEAYQNVSMMGSDGYGVVKRYFKVHNEGVDGDVEVHIDSGSHNESSIEENIDEKIVYRKGRGPGGKSSLFTHFAILSIISIASVSTNPACTNTLSRSFSTETCVYHTTGVNAGSVVCDVGFDIVDDLLGVDDIACITMAPTNHPESTIDLTIRRVFDTCTLQSALLYPTSTFTARSVDIYNCAGTAECSALGGGQSACDSQSATNDWTLFGNLGGAGDEALYHWPGESSCFRTCTGTIFGDCGTATLGCATATKGCSWITWAIDITNGEQFTVEYPNQKVCNSFFELNISVPDAGGGFNLQTTYILVDSGSASNLPFVDSNGNAASATVDITSVSVPPLSELFPSSSEAKFICPDNYDARAEGCVVGPANDVGDYTPNNIGTIQFNSYVHNALPANGRNAFQYSSNICTINTPPNMGTVNEYPPYSSATCVADILQDIYTLTDPNGALVYQKFPVMHNGLLYYLDESTLTNASPDIYTTDLDFGSTGYVYQSTGTFTIIQNVDDVDYQIALVSGSVMGCYLCDGGAEFSVTVTDDADVGGHVAYSKDPSSDSNDCITLSGGSTGVDDDTTSTVAIGFVSECKSGSFDVIFSWGNGGSKSVTITVDYALNDPTGTSPGNGTNTDTKDEKEGGAGGLNGDGFINSFVGGIGAALAGVFGGSASFWTDFIHVLMWIGVFVIGILLFALIMGILRAIKMKKN